MWPAPLLDRADQLRGQVPDEAGGGPGGEEVLLHHLPVGPRGQVPE